MSQSNISDKFQPGQAFSRLLHRHKSPDHFPMHVPPLLSSLKHRLSHLPRFSMPVTPLLQTYQHRHPDLLPFPTPMIPLSVTYQHRLLHLLFPHCLPSHLLPSRHRFHTHLHFPMLTAIPRSSFSARRFTTSSGRRL